MNPMASAGGLPLHTPGTAPAAAAPPAVRAVLRVLNGEHAGAQTAVEEERLLVGSDVNECDLILDVKASGFHACLLRLGDEGWTVLSVAGDLWLERNHVGPGSVKALKPLQVLTLGRVAFALASSDAAVDWSVLRPPDGLLKPAGDGWLPQLSLPASAPLAIRVGHGLRLAAGLGVVALVMGGVWQYVSEAWTAAAAAPASMQRTLQAMRQELSALPFAREVTLQLHPEAAGRLLAQGYVRERAQLKDLGAALQPVGAELRVHVVAELQTALLQRIGGVGAEDLRYEGAGRFEARSSPQQLKAHDRAARAALQELPALAALALKVEGLPGGDGQPVLLRYERSASRGGDLLVSNVDEVLARLPRQQAFTVKEVRMGRTPSVLLSDGRRYFEGALLPGRVRLESVTPSSLVVVDATGTAREVPLGEANLLLEPETR